ncbi:MAG TPA: hypothetical protein VGB20_05560 [bacterium]
MAPMQLTRRVLGGLLLAAMSMGVAAAQTVRTEQANDDAYAPAARGATPEWTAGRVSAGGGVGILGSTPDDAALALTGNAEYFLSPEVSVGPLMQLGLTGDMTLVGLSGQGKYYILLPDTGDRGRISLQGGLGFVHADYLRDDTSWLVPLGMGYDYTLDSGAVLSANALVNFTDLHTGFGSGADVMPGFNVGVRF